MSPFLSNKCQCGIIANETGGCITCDLVTFTLSTEMADLYASLYRDFLSGELIHRTEKRVESHLVSVGNMTLWEEGPEPAKTLWDRLRLWVFGYSAGS